MNIYVLLIPLVLSSLFVVWPLLRSVPREMAYQQDYNDLPTDNIELFEQQQQDLARELQQGIISQQIYDLRYVELQRILLSDLQQHKTPKRCRSTGGYLLLTVAILVPLCGWLTYIQLGAMDGVEQRQNIQVTRHLIAQVETIEQVITTLEIHLREQPDNPEGWLILANAYMQREQFGKGLAAFVAAKAHTDLGSPQRAVVLGQYAQALFIVDDDFSPRVLEALKESMAANPRDVPSLSLLGIQAFSAQDYGAAIGFWQQALERSGGSQGAQYLRASIASAEQQFRVQQGIDVGAASVMVDLRLANGLRLPESPNAVLFVYARVPGQRMPLLATKLAISDLPKQVVLNNSMVLQAGTDLGQHQIIDLVAHIAKSGTPGQQPGDLVGQVQGVSVVGGQVIDLVIDKIVTRDNETTDNMSRAKKSN